MTREGFSELNGAGCTSRDGYTERRVRSGAVPDVDALLPHGGGHVVLLDDPLGQQLLVGQDARR